jgi:hypothetical protein
VDIHVIVLHVLVEVEVAQPDLLALGWSQSLAPGRAPVGREALARSPVPVLLVPTPDSPG